MDISINEKLIIPFKKFSRLRINVISENKIEGARNNLKETESERVISDHMCRQIKAN